MLIYRLDFWYHQSYHECQGGCGERALLRVKDPYRKGLKSHGVWWNMCENHAAQLIGKNARITMTVKSFP